MNRNGSMRVFRTTSSSGTSSGIRRMILLYAKGQKELKEDRAEKEMPLIPENFKDGIPVEQITKFMHMPPEAVQKITDDSQAPNKNCVSL